MEQIFLTTLNMEISQISENVRVEDFLNEKLQKDSDLDSLENLIASIEVQQKHLEEQVSDELLLV